MVCASVLLGLLHKFLSRCTACDEVAPRYRFALVPALCSGDETESRPFPQFSDAELDTHARSALILEHIKV